MNKNKAEAVLTGISGEITTQRGDMVLVVSVDLDANDYDGTISANDRIKESDYITLMKVVCEQCLMDLESPLMRDAAAFTLRTMIDKYTKNEMEGASGGE